MPRITWNEIETRAVPFAACPSAMRRELLAGPRLNWRTAIGTLRHPSASHAPRFAPTAPSPTATSR